MENENNSPEVYQDDTYFIELQLISTILKVGEDRRKSEGRMSKTALDFISEHHITSEHFYDPQLRQVFEYIQRSTTDSATLDTPSITDLEYNFPGISSSIGDYTNNIEELMNKADEAKLFHELSATLSQASKLLQTNSNEGLTYLQSEIDSINAHLSRIPYDIIQNAQDRYDQREKNKKHEGLDAVPTGFPQLDKDIYGLSNGEELLVLFARTGVGKAQPLTSRVLTPDGYILMKDVEVGQQIITGTGEIARVDEIFPQGVIDYYKVYFKDNLGDRYIVECSYEHLWKVKGKYDKEYKVLPLYYVMNHLENNYKVDFVSSKVFKVVPLKYTIDKVEYGGKTACQCLMVDHPDHTYVTNQGIVTHNTWVLLQMLHEAWKSGRNVALIEPEMSPQRIGYRFDTLANRGKFSNTSLTFGKVMDNEEDYLEYIDDLKESKRKFLCVHPNYFGDRLTVSTLKAFCKQNKVEVLGVDGLSYMMDERGKLNDSTTTALTHIAADLMSLSIDLSIPVIAIVQSNRENGVAQGGRLGLDNIRDSDGIAFSASTVCGLYKKREALHIQLLKSRFGPVGQTYAYDWDIDKGTFSFLGYGDVEDEDFGIEAGSGDRNAYSYSNSRSTESKSETTRVQNSRTSSNMSARARHASQEDRMPYEDEQNREERPEDCF